MRRRWSWVVGPVLVGCSAANPAPPVSATSPSATSAKPAKSVAERLAAAGALYDESEYDKAEAEYRAILALAAGADKTEALIGWSRVLLITGRYAEAMDTAHQAGTLGAKKHVTLPLIADAQRRQGKLEAARSTLDPLREEPAARLARLQLGEVLLELGQRERAEPVLMSLIEDYNEDRIDKGDAFSLAMVGRAAHLLRSPHDANDAFNEAERAREAHTQTLLWRAELFLEKYDIAHAEQVVNELLKKAPQHPEAKVWLAHVKLEQALDFDAAEELANEALAVNPKLSSAYAVLAGIALRDMELGRADDVLSRGLEHDPRDLELLSLRAAVRFLADDAAGFDAAQKKVLELNPEYAKLYQIVGEYAEWEHRYDDIVEMMRKAVRLDPTDGKAHAQLGLNLIRGGDDDAGIVSLRTAFRYDPFNVRVHNTLNLYEKVIPNEYESVRRGRFEIRYPKAERALLDRYVPELLNQAYAEMEEHYGFTPQSPIGIELYSTRQAFSVRTSGLPHTAIQGVCFGKTLASMSLGEEKFNLGMTLWHELAHVFHIQQSKNHVPRWFTEGLAEYETIIERPEWAREHDPDLYEALRAKRLPKVAAMTRAFTRAEQISDVATAYYASSQILSMMVQEHGMPKMADMLELWASGKRTPDVVQAALGVTANDLDARFRQHTLKRLSPYEKQFVPLRRAGHKGELRQRLKKNPNDADALVRLALAALQDGAGPIALQLIDRALKAEPKHPDARFLKARMELELERPQRAREIVQHLVRDGHDGYEPRMLLAATWDTEKSPSEAKEALEAAHTFDPSQSEAVLRLALLSKRTHDADAELGWLGKLAQLEQHQGSVYRRLLELLIEQKDYARAVEIGEAGIWADLSDLWIHVHYAEALHARGKLDQALFELESAALCDGRPDEKVRVHERLAELYRKRGRNGQAREHQKQAEEYKTRAPH